MVGVVNVDIETFFCLPCNPFSNCRFECAVSDNKHLDRVLPHVRVLIINVVDSSFVEHCLVNASEIWVECAYKVIFSCCFVIASEAHFNINVVINTDCVVCSVILDRVHCESCDLYATHCSLDLNLSDRTFCETFLCICLGAIFKRNILWLLILAEFRLHRDNLVHAIISKIINLCCVTFHRNCNILCSYRNSKEFVSCRKIWFTKIT